MHDSIAPEPQTISSTSNHKAVCQRSHKQTCVHPFHLSESGLRRVRTLGRGLRLAWQARLVEGPIAFCRWPVAREQTRLALSFGCGRRSLQQTSNHRLHQRQNLPISTPIAIATRIRHIQTSSKFIHTYIDNIKCIHTEHTYRTRRLLNSHLPYTTYALTDTHIFIF